jgi:hypothetical protein
MPPPKGGDYLDSRIEVYRRVPDMEAVKALLARSVNSSSRDAGTP